MVRGVQGGQGYQPADPFLRRDPCYVPRTEGQPEHQARFPQIYSQLRGGWLEPWLLSRQGNPVWSLCAGEMPCLVTWALSDDPGPPSPSAKGHVAKEAALQSQECHL